MEVDEGESELRADSSSLPLPAIQAVGAHLASTYLFQHWLYPGAGEFLQQRILTLTAYLSSYDSLAGGSPLRALPGFESTKLMHDPITEKPAAYGRKRRRV